MPKRAKKSVDANRLPTAVVARRTDLSAYGTSLLGGAPSAISTTPPDLPFRRGGVVVGLPKLPIAPNLPKLPKGPLGPLGLLGGGIKLMAIGHKKTLGYLF